MTPVMIMIIPMVLKGVSNDKIESTLPSITYARIRSITDVPPLIPSTGDSTVTSLYMNPLKEKVLITA
jgi:hypothetical protein